MNRNSKQIDHGRNFRKLDEKIKFCLRKLEFCKQTIKITLLANFQGEFQITSKFYRPKCHNFINDILQMEKYLIMLLLLEKFQKTAALNGFLVS